MLLHIKDLRDLLQKLGVSDAQIAEITLALVVAHKNEEASGTHKIIERLAKELLELNDKYLALQKGISQVINDHEPRYHRNYF